MLDVQEQYAAAIDGRVGETMEDALAARIRANPAYQELVRTRRTFGWSLTVLMLVIYYGFVMLVAFAPSVIGQKLIGSVTVGIVVGLAVIVSAIVLTGLYVLRANSHYDALSRRIVVDARVPELVR